MDNELTQKDRKNQKFLRLRRIRKRAAFKSKTESEEFNTAKLEREIAKKRKREERKEKEEREEKESKITNEAFQ